MKGDYMTKELSELTIDELWALFPIILKEHNQEYFKWYSEMKTSLLDCLSETRNIKINHIGSSAVMGLLSKPTIDILLEIPEESIIDDISKQLLDDGWLLMSSTKIPAINYVFNKGYTKFGFADKVYHLHVRCEGDWDELYFRDYLIDNENVAKEYAKLKLSLIDLYRNNRDGYTEAKSDFIKEKTRAARILYGDRYKKKKAILDTSRIEV